VTERRKYLRANSKIEFLCYDTNHLETVYSIKSKNISAGGLLLIYNKDFPEGTVLHIGVDLNRPECGAETVKSKILRCNRIKDNIYELGVQFLDISDEMKGCITNFVEENKNKQPLSDYQQYLENNRIWRLGVPSVEDQ
jgi:c-di-GMP-binding flagellar brake protein YcgR